MFSIYKTIVFFSLVVVSKIACDYYFRKSWIKKDKRTKIVTEINEVIMFTYGAPQLTTSKYSRCNITQSMGRLLYYLNSPCFTLDICMYALSNQDLANIIIRVSHKNVVVRIIVDAEMAYCSGSYIKYIESQGIPVRWQRSSALMHHKFCVIDASIKSDLATPLVIMGSLNWTKQAVTGNWEDVTVTSQKDIVEQFRIEFERLWESFKKPLGP